MLTGWWWPGIMLVIGTALAAERVLEGRVMQALSVFIICLAIPFVSTIVQHIAVPWHLAGPFILVALGLVSLTRLSAAQQP
jgi:hypothetical protein